MGEIISNMYTTLDGVFEANGGPDPWPSDFVFPGWQTQLFDEETSARATADVQDSDALLLGRRTYDIFAPYWPGQSGDIADVFNKVPKYLASRGTPELSWDATTQLTDPAAELPEIRARHRSVQLWGSGTLVRALLAAGLLDRLNLYIYPIVLGQGQRLFDAGTVPASMTLTEPAVTTSGGVLILRYAITSDPPVPAR